MTMPNCHTSWEVLALKRKQRGVSGPGRLPFGAGSAEWNVLAMAQGEGERAKRGRSLSCAFKERFSVGGLAFFPRSVHVNVYIIVVFGKKDRDDENNLRHNMKSFHNGNIFCNRFCSSHTCSYDGFAS